MDWPWESSSLVKCDIKWVEQTLISVDGDNGHDRETLLTTNGCCHCGFVYTQLTQVDTGQSQIG